MLNFVAEGSFPNNTKIEGGFLGLLAGLAARALLMIAKTVLPALGIGALSGLASSGVERMDYVIKMVNFTSVTKKLISKKIILRLKM